MYWQKCSRSSMQFNIDLFCTDMILPKCDFQGGTHLYARFPECGFIVCLLRILGGKKLGGHFEYCAIRNKYRQIKMFLEFCPPFRKHCAREKTLRTYYYYYYYWTAIPRTSGGHSRGYPDPKLRSGPSKSWKNKHLGVDIHDPKARTSTTLRDFQKLRPEKLRAEFSFPDQEIFPPHHPMHMWLAN